MNTRSDPIDIDKLLHMIAVHPLIQVVKLADACDCDISDIEDALLPHLNRRVFAREVVVDHRKVITYVLSDEYRVEALLKYHRTQPANQPAPYIVKQVKAIDYLKTIPGNRCTNTQMARVIGAVQPLPHLYAPLQDGSLRREGTDWLLGDEFMPLIGRSVEGGLIEIRRHGQLLAALTPEECDRLAGFVMSMREVKGQVATQNT